MAGKSNKRAGGDIKRPARMYAKKRQLTPGKDRGAVSTPEPEQQEQPKRIESGVPFRRGRHWYKFVDTKTGRLLVVLKPGAEK